MTFLPLPYPVRPYVRDAWQACASFSNSLDSCAPCCARHQVLLRTNFLENVPKILFWQFRVFPRCCGIFCQAIFFSKFGCRCVSMYVCVFLGMGLRYVLLQFYIILFFFFGRDWRKYREMCSVLSVANGSLVPIVLPVLLLLLFLLFFWCVVKVSILFCFLFSSLGGN